MEWKSFTKTDADKLIELTNTSPQPIDPGESERLELLHLRFCLGAVAEFSERALSVVANDNMRLALANIKNEAHERIESITDYLKKEENNDD